MNRFLKIALGLITFITCVVYFASCFTPFISPEIFWPMAFLALAFPYLAVFEILLIVVWLFIKRKVAILLFFLLLIGWQNIYSTFAFHVNYNNSLRAKSKSTLRILSWNVRSFDNTAKHADSAGSVRRKMFNFIIQSQADILCLQEFTEYIGPSFLSNTKQLVEAGYKYYYKTDALHRYYGWGSVQTGSAIFSRLPLADSGKVLLGDSSYPEYLTYADIPYLNKPVRIFTAHLKSLNLFATSDNSAQALFHNDTYMIYEAPKFVKLKVFAQEHARQSRIIKEQLEASPHPIVFAGDLNSVPSSFTYHHLSDGLNDAFIKKGWGLGTSIHNLPPTLRIDVLLTDKNIVLENYYQDSVLLSDHYPHVIDVELP